MAFIKNVFLLLSLFTSSVLLANELSFDSIFYKNKAQLMSSLIARSNLEVSDVSNANLRTLSEYSALFIDSCLREDYGQKLSWKESKDKTQAIFFCRDGNSQNSRESLFIATLADKNNLIGFNYFSAGPDDSQMTSESSSEVGRKIITVSIASFVAKESAILIWPTEPDKVLHSVGSAWLATAVVIWDKKYRKVSDKEAVRDAIIISFIANALKKANDLRKRGSSHFDYAEAVRDTAAGTLGGAIGAIGINYEIVFKGL